jgi:hypothetical protein
MGGVIYVQIKPSLITVKNLFNGTHFQDIPQIAVQAFGRRMKVVAYGKQANFPYSKPPEMIVLNAFHHSRSLISDFEVAEKTLGIFLKQVDRRKIRLRQLLTALATHTQPSSTGGKEERCRTPCCKRHSPRRIHFNHGNYNPSAAISAAPHTSEE